MENKMILEIINEKNEIVNTFESQKAIITKLASILWSKYINGSDWITKKSYKYNYSDKQTITFYTNNKYKFRFKNIPTNWGGIEEYKIIELLEV